MLHLLINNIFDNCSPAEVSERGPDPRSGLKLTCLRRYSSLRRIGRVHGVRPIRGPAFRPRDTRAA